MHLQTQKWRKTEHPSTETIKLLKSRTSVSEIVTKVATVGNAKLFYQLMAEQVDPILIGQAITERA